MGSQATSGLYSILDENLDMAVGAFAKCCFGMTICWASFARCLLLWCENICTNDYAEVAQEPELGGVSSYCVTDGFVTARLCFATAQRRGVTAAPVLRTLTPF